MYVCTPAIARAGSQVLLVRFVQISLSTVALRVMLGFLHP
jgi:hypothetical protein